MISLRKTDWRNLTGFLLGASTVLAFAPFAFYPLALVAPALLFYLWLSLPARRAAWLGLSYGLGFMLFGLFWLHISISKFGGVNLPLAIVAAMLFAAMIALFYALAGFVAQWLAGRFDLSDTLKLTLLYPAVWVLSEMLRGYLFGGFPWLVLGYSQIDSLLSAVAPLAGVYAVSWLTLLFAGLLVLLVIGRGRARIFAAGFLLSAAAGLTAVAGHSWTRADGPSQSVRMVQANIDQEIKWQPANLLPTLELYSRMTFEAPADLVIWPETAVPAFYHKIKNSFLGALERDLREKNMQLVLGIPFWSETQKRYYNSMISLGSKEMDRYDKRHLVPFGEFMPLDFLLRPLLDFMHIPMSNFQAGNAPQPLLQTGDYFAGVSICYEDVFGNENIQALPQAAYLINISNDAWFGDSLAPYQHLQMARMRALETSRYMLRATNTGVSAIIDDRGQLTAVSQQGQRETITGTFEPRSGITPYARFSDWMILALLCVLPGLALLFAGFKRAKS